MRKTDTGKLTRMALLLSVMLIIGAFERRIVIVPGIPGIKPGLSNAILLYALAAWGRKETYLLMLMKAVLGGLLYAGAGGMLYSLAGGIAAVSVMCALKGIRGLSAVGISVSGAVMHIAGQVVFSRFWLGSWAAAFQIPYLIAGAVVTGIINGILSVLLAKAAARFDKR